MALLVPDVGEVILLGNLIAGGTLENMTLKLYKTNVTPAESDTAGSYTVADFTSYTNKTLTRSVNNGVTWGTVATNTGVTSSSYVAQSWTAGSTQTIYGYYVVGATSTVLLWAELFGVARTLASGDVLNLTPKLQLD